MDEFITQLMACEEIRVSASPPHTTVAVESSDGSHNEEQTNTTTVTATQESPIDHDIAILTDTYGPLEPGMVITLDIASACDLLHKKRRRSDAFQVLQKKLGEMGVTLQIISRKYTKT